MNDTYFSILCHLIRNYSCRCNCRDISDNCICNECCSMYKHLSERNTYHDFIVVRREKAKELLLRDFPDEALEVLL